MKLELPLALGLLAIGCWLFLPRTGGSSRPPESPSTSTAAATVAPAQFAEEVLSPDPGSRMIPTRTPSAQAAQTDTSPRSRSLLRQAARNLRNGPPVQAECRLQVRLFEQSVNATGQYLQGGQGSPHSQLRLLVDPGPDRLEMIQTCDGEFCYLETLRGDASELVFYDLQHIAADAERYELPFAGSSTAWLSMGGIPSMLDQLDILFDLQPAESVRLGDVPMWRIRGDWKPNRLRQLLSHYVHSELLAPDIRWEELPPQVPHSVELYLGNDDFLPQFPYRIVFRRNGEERPLLQLELHDVARLTTVDEDAFRVDSNQERRRDITDRFTTRLEKFGQDRAGNRPAIADAPSENAPPRR